MKEEGRSRLYRILHMDKEEQEREQQAGVREEGREEGVLGVLHRVRVRLMGTFSNLRKKVVKVKRKKYKWKIEKEREEGDSEVNVSSFIPSVRDSGYYSLSLSVSECEDTVSTHWEDSPGLQGRVSSVGSEGGHYTASSNSHQDGGHCLSCPSHGTLILTPILPRDPLRDPHLPYGVHLQGPHPVSEGKVDLTPGHRHYIGGQLSLLQSRTRCALLDMFPHLTDTVSLLFLPHPLPVLRRLSIGQVSSLLLSLSHLLHSPHLSSSPWGDITLFSSLSLLCAISSITETIPGLESLPYLVLQCKHLCVINYHHTPSLCWQEIRSLHLHLWSALILAPTHKHLLTHTF